MIKRFFFLSNITWKLHATIINQLILKHIKNTLLGKGRGFKCIILVPAMRLSRKYTAASVENASLLLSTVTIDKGSRMENRDPCIVEAIRSSAIPPPLPPTCFPPRWSVARRSSRCSNSSCTIVFSSCSEEKLSPENKDENLISFESNDNYRHFFFVVR